MLIITTKFNDAELYSIELKFIFHHSSSFNTNISYLQNGINPNHFKIILIIYNLNKLA